MKIEVLAMFRDGYNTFHVGELRVVSDEDGARFCDAGWARDLAGAASTGTPDTSPKTLTVENGKHVSKTTRI